MIGQTIGHYKITAKLGAGGMGEVYLADDTKLGRQVALKFLPSSVWNEEDAQKRLIREAQAASKLDHPNIVTIHGIDEFEGQPFIIMAHVPGSTLKEYCNAASRPIEELVGIAIQIADGLQHAHEAGVIHRDLKPSNVLVDSRGRARILDFGIASLRGAAKLTQTGTTVGTLAYAPPELTLGKEAQATSDVYSLGVVIYEMLAGQLPFAADHEAALVYSILHESPKPLSDCAADIPVNLQTIIMRCLAKQPENRYSSCAELSVELKRSIKRERSGGGEESKDKPSIAVLPFTNMSADPENEYFSDGLTEELLNVLAKNPGLKVTGRTSCFAFKGRNEDLREIGLKLGVGALLEGSVRKAGNRVRITTQLVKTADGFHLWSETYDRVVDDIFAVQDDIAKSVSEAMHTTLLGQAPVSDKRNASAKSYNILLQANHFASRNTRDALAKSIELFSQVLAIDPNDAAAWAGLGRSYATQGGYGYEDNDASYRKAKEACLKALAIDDSVSEAHDLMGWIYLGFEHNFEGAGREFRRAHELAPGRSRHLIGLANYESTIGLNDEAIRHVEESIEIDPLNPMLHHWSTRIYLAARRFELAAGACTKAMELSPGMTSAAAIKGIALMHLGRLDEALASCLTEGMTGYRTCGLAIIYHAMGETAKSDEQLALLLAEGEQWGVQIAMVYAFREENDAAFHWLESALRLNDPGLSVVKYAPLFDNLHEDPRWLPYLKKVGFPD